MYLITQGKIIALVTIFQAAELVISDQLPTCKPSDFKYAFTECDIERGRWRVSVPETPARCTGGAPNAPIRVDNCYTSCNAGYFYNSSLLQCKSCAPGYYSLGGGIEYTSFNAQSLKKSGFLMKSESTSSKYNCSGWQIRDGILESNSSRTSDSECISIISHTVNVVKPGKLRFSYHYVSPEDNPILFTFGFRNYEDNAVENPLLGGYRNMFLEKTNPQKFWQTTSWIKLRKAGLYVFVWRSMSIGNRRTFAQSEQMQHNEIGNIRIKSIELYGIAYASECTPCQAGTYTSESNSSNCEACPRDTFSSVIGATQCINCTQSDYSPVGSTGCHPRPKCTIDDYYEIVEKCSKDTGKQAVAFKWVMPKICYQNGETIKPIREFRECNVSETDSECNPGMELDDGKCKFCSEDYSNDGTLVKCEKCAASTLPEYKLLLNSWRNELKEDSLAPSLSAVCILDVPEINSECDSESWNRTPASKESYIRTSSNANLKAYLILTLSVDGFRVSTGGILTFEFEIKCADGDTCKLMLIENQGDNEVNNIIQEWDGDITGIQKYKHFERDSSPVAFSWVFKRSNAIQSHARIYEIGLTHALGAGAIRCAPCPHDDERSCIPCPTGQYLEVQHIHKGNLHTHVYKKANCKMCPPGTIIDQDISFPVGNKSCIKCGPELISDTNRTSCYSDCKFVIDGNAYDLSEIPQPLSMNGLFSYTSVGTKYFHSYNFTICGLKQSVCRNNVTLIDSIGDTRKNTVTSNVCRSTIFPDTDKVYATQSISLGDELIGISKSKSFQNITIPTEFSDIASDIHMYFRTSIPTIACRFGRALTVTLRCTPDAQDAIIKAPANCSGGTCDGCNFHFNLLTKHACRTCTEMDYQTVVGQCIDGRQQIHYINPKACIIPEITSQLVKERACSSIPKVVQLGIMIVSFSGIVLLALVFHFWKKNRNLEYKYSKLVDNKNTADCCGMDEDEEDERDLRTGIKNPNASGSSHYETIHLTKQGDSTDII